MTFEEFIGDRIETMSSNEYADVHYAWEAGIQEGIERMHMLYATRNEDMVNMMWKEKSDDL